MKRLFSFVAALLLFGMSGCLFIEKLETRVRFIKKDKDTPEQAQITLVYHNISSDAKDEKGLQKDFDELLKAVIKAGGESETEDGMIVKKREIAIANGKINVRAEAVPEDGKIEDVIANGERILVLERDEETELVETNATVFKTKENYLLVWPESLEEIYWIQRFHAESAEDKDAIARNQPELVRRLAQKLNAQ